jgi:hypothetical protein
MMFRDLIAEVVLLSLLVYGCVYAQAPMYSVEPLPEYDALFCRTKGWTGADGAYTTALADDLTLWLYGDTWIGDVVDGKHKDATIVNNTIALQRGKEPATVSVEFFWGTAEDGKPEAFFKPDDGKGWFWIYDGVVADGKLYLFLMQTIKTEQDSVFGFEQVGTWLGEIENPNDEPSNWQVKQYKVPYGRYSKNGNMFFGSAVMRDRDFVYIYGAYENWSKGMSGRSMIVARVPHNKMADFKEWRFFRDGEWQNNVTNISKLFDGIATEYSVCYQPGVKQYVIVYTENGMSKNILMRFAPSPVGPWSSACKVYECPDEKWHKTYFCYAAKAHPEISEADELIVTYVCNSNDFWQMAADAKIYRPRFVKIKFDVQKE